MSCIVLLQMGYAMPTQIGKGIHLRQYSRAFVIADATKKSRVVFVSIDACMGTQIMKMQVTCFYSSYCSC